MELRLDDAQATLLQEVLDSSWRELRYEIADTDNSTFKAELRERGERLRSLLDLGRRAATRRGTEGLSGQPIAVR